MRYRILILLLMAIGWYVFITGILLPIYTGYEYFTMYAATIINKKQRVDAIREHLSPHYFHYIKLVVSFAAVLLVLLTGLAVYKINLLCRAASRCFAVFKKATNVWKRNWHDSMVISRCIFTIAMVYTIGRALYLMHTIPYTHDETYTIPNFILPGPIVSTTFYPYPNNHILFSIVCWPFKYLPLPPEYAFRLPALFAIVICCFILYLLFKQLTNDFVASIGISIFVLLLPVMTYSFLARGYGFVFMFFAFNLYCVINFIKTKNKTYSRLFILFSVLGLYTVPSFIYCYGSVVIAGFFQLLWLRQKEQLRAFIKSIAITGMVTLLLYIPIMIASGGWKGFLSVIYFGYDESYGPSFARIWRLASDIYLFHFFEQRPLTAIFFVVVFVWLVLYAFARQKENRYNTFIALPFALVGLSIPLLSFIVQHKYPPERIHGYMSLCIALLIVLILGSFRKAVYKKVVGIAAVLAFLGLNIAFALKSAIIHNEIKPDTLAWEITDKLFENRSSGTDTCYSFSVFFITTIQMKWALAQKDIVVYQVEPNSPSTRLFDLNEKYPWIITSYKYPLNDSNKLHAEYIPILTRKEAVLWKRKQQ